MHPFHHAAATPDKPAIVMGGSGETLTYAELDARSNRIAQLFRSHGLKTGDGIALFMENCLDFLAICWGAQRAGLVFTCLSSKLGLDEARYIVADSGSRLVVASAGLAGVAQGLEAELGRYAVGGAIPGYADFAAAVAAQPAERIADEAAGRDMLYSSGTTGRPKGIVGRVPEGPIDQPDALTMLVKMLYGFDGDTVYLSPAPLYHAAPLRYSMSVMKLGGTVVVMEKFDPERYLDLVARHRVTHSQLVPTMFVKMLKLPDDVRARADVSSLKAAIHAAAPCPVEVKRRMLDWWGPKIFEYYSATEGAGFVAISPTEWLAKPGSVGKALLGEIRIVDDAGALLPPGREGRIFFHGGPEFAYHGDAAKTAGAKGEHGATFGDIGYVDEDGYLFLTDRAAYMIISGGVNVYPQETEDVLVMHDKVADVAVIGVPDEELGEAVKAVVQPRDWADATPELAAELMAFARGRLSHVKCPKSVDFERELPRHETGKLYKRLLKDRYWPAKAG
jgi:acyl-CoA synthetase (AMP-forming)/AMP-acid ligase II